MVPHGGARPGAGRPRSIYDRPPPRYDGPDWIGKPITPTRPELTLERDWVGKRIVVRSAPRRWLTKELPPGGWMGA